MEQNKPITLIREDLRNSIIIAINESGLPLFIIEDLLNGVLYEISSLVKQQLEQDIIAYESAKAQNHVESQTEEVNKE